MTRKKAEPPTIDRELFEACNREGPRDAETIGSLLRRGARPDRLHKGKYSVEVSPLIALLQHRQPDAEASIVELLLRAGADPNFCASDGTTPLYVAASYNLPAIVGLLLDAGARTDVVVREAAFGGTALHIAVRIHGDQAAELVERLLAHGADPNVWHKGQTVLHHAIAENAWHVAEILVAQGARHDADDLRDAIWGGGSLYAALTHPSADELPSVERIRWLVATGANPKMPDADGNSVIFSAAWHHPQLVPLLVELGAELERPNTAGRTPLLNLAAQNGRPESLAALVDAGAVLDQRDVEGRTAIWYAVENQNESNLRCLLHAGADATIPDGEGLTPLALAQTRRLVTLQRMLDPSAAIERDSWLDLLLNAIAGRRVLRTRHAESFEFGLRLDDGTEVFWHGHEAHPRWDRRRSRSRAWLAERLAWLAQRRPGDLLSFLGEVCQSLGLAAPSRDELVASLWLDERPLIEQARVPLRTSDIGPAIVEGLLAGAKISRSDKEGFESWFAEDGRIVKEEGAWETFRSVYTPAEARRYWRDWGRIVDGMAVPQRYSFGSALNEALVALGAPTLRAYLRRRGRKPRSRAVPGVATARRKP